MAKIVNVTHVCLHLACSLSVNHSLGLIDVAPSADNNPLNCSWTIGNVGIANAVATFIIERINISSCRYLEDLSYFLLFWCEKSMVCTVCRHSNDFL